MRTVYVVACCLVLFLYAMIFALARAAALSERASARQVREVAKRPSPQLGQRLKRRLLAAIRAPIGRHY